MKRKEHNHPAAPANTPAPGAVADHQQPAALPPANPSAPSAAADAATAGATGTLYAALQRLLAPGEAIGRQLAVSAKGLSPQAKRLHQRVKKGVGTIRTSLSQLSKHASDPEPPGQLVRRLLIADRVDDPPDPVLRFILFSRLGLADPSGHLVEDAHRAYHLAAEHYRAILGDLVAQTMGDQWPASPDAVNFDMDNHVTARDDWDEAVRRLHRQRRYPDRGLPTGYRSLDAHFPGVRQLTVLTGGTPAVRTAIALGFVRHALERHPDLVALYLSLRLPKQTLYHQLFCAEAGTTYDELVGPAWGRGLRRQLDRAAAPLAALCGRLRVMGGSRLGQRDGRLAEVVRGGLDALLQLPGIASGLVVIDAVEHLPGGDGGDPARWADVLRAQRETRRPTQHAPGVPILALSDHWGSVRSPEGKPLPEFALAAVLTLELPGPGLGGELPLQVRVADRSRPVERDPVLLLYERSRCRVRELLEGPPAHEVPAARRRQPH